MRNKGISLENGRKCLKVNFGKTKVMVSGGFDGNNGLFKNNV